jgi:hypothetical protein
MAYTAYKDRDNTFAIQFIKNGVVLTQSEIEAITKVELLHNGNYYNSTNDSSGFDLVTRKADGIIVFKLGEISDIGQGQDENAEIIIYSADYPDGVVWETIDLTVIELYGS